MKPLRHLFILCTCALALLCNCTIDEFIKDSSGGGSTTPAPQPKSTIMTRLNSSSADVVSDAVSDAFALSPIPDDITAKLNELVKTHPSPDIREEIIDEISMTDRTGPFMDSLKHAVNDPNFDVRETAVYALEDIEKKKSIDILIYARGSRFQNTRVNAQDALEFLTDKEFKTQAQWQGWWNNNRATFSF